MGLDQVYGFVQEWGFGGAFLVIGLFVLVRGRLKFEYPYDPERGRAGGGDPGRGDPRHPGRGDPR